MAARHDLGYKLLFAHPELVREPLAGFTPFPWLAAVDVASFERVNPHHVSDQFCERHDDIVWRIRIGDQWLYVYVLLEFQSGVDRSMALRMQVYIGLLYQDPAGLADFQASQRYFLIDQSALDPAALAAQRSTLAPLFRLELSEIPDVVSDVPPLLAAWFSEDAQARAALRAILARVLVKRYGALPVGVAEQIEHAPMDELEQWMDRAIDGDGGEAVYAALAGRRQAPPAPRGAT